MPLIHSKYNAPLLAFNSTLQTIIPNTRRIQLNYKRERLTLSDGDFVDLDWLTQNADQLVVLTHGLAGCSTDVYIAGMAAWLFQQGYDVLAWNCRSCSGEVNRKLRLYFHGEIEDIHEVILHALQKKDYQSIHLVGFSMGGSIVLKYAGVHSTHLPSPVKKVVAISTPCDLASSAVVIDDPINWYFRRRMSKPLKEKALAKADAYPEIIDSNNMKYVKTWRDFDEYFGAPINGFKSTEALYKAGSAINFMDGIQIPTLILNARNDTFLAPASYPETFCKNHPFVYLEIPKQGGHVGFPSKTYKRTWAEERVGRFLRLY